MGYTPDRGDFVWLQLTSVAEAQPALVISPAPYNKKTGRLICCLVTSVVKGYPFEVLASGKKIKGAVLADQLKNLDWKSGKIKLIDKASDDVMLECLAKISALIFDERKS